MDPTVPQQPASPEAQAEQLRTASTTIQQNSSVAYLVFYDASIPPPTPPAGYDGVAFYIGGDTPHVWTPAEISETKARYRLPIFVRSNPAAASAAADGSAAIEALRRIGAPAGTLVSWDTETAADPAYMAAVYRLVTAAGYHLMDYGSQDSLFGNEIPPGGYYWGADWNGDAAVLAGDAGTQYASGPWDRSVFKAGLPFWDTRAGTTPPPPPPAPAPVDWQGKLPTVGRGAAPGELVKSIQGLCGARGVPVMMDGIFGIDTTTAVELVQRHAGIAADGIVGPHTWPVLLGIA